MITYPTLHLAAHKEEMIHRRHPWIFSGAIKRKSKGLQDGEVVNVLGKNDTVLATGHYQEGSIMCRILSFGPRLIDQAFYSEILQNAFNYRRDVLEFPNEHTDTFRLVHGEGDHLPGLVIDIYGDTAVVQCHSVGMYRQLELITQGLRSIQGFGLKSIYHKSKESHIGTTSNQMIWGEEKEEVTVRENGNTFIINFADGQKTGFFLDQRDNRDLLGHLSKGKRVLNLFAYTGGFSVYAQNNGAIQTDSVDISASAIALLSRNMDLCDSQNPHHDLIANVLDYVKDCEDPLPYDIIIVDPPAFAKSVKKRHNAVMAYKRLNSAVMAKSKPGTIILTFSCSQVVDPPLFYNTIMSAAIDANRPARVLKHLSQGADHPVNIFHQEGHYLKGLLLVLD